MQSDLSANLFGNVREDCNPEVPIRNMMLFIRRDAEKLWVGVRRRDKTMDKGVKRDRKPGRMSMHGCQAEVFHARQSYHNKAYKANDAPACLIERLYDDVVA